MRDHIKRFIKKDIESYPTTPMLPLRLAHYIYQLQTRGAVLEDFVTVLAYLDALQDVNIINTEQKGKLLLLADKAHTVLKVHCEPYVKIPYPEICAEIEKILKDENTTESITI